MSFVKQSTAGIKSSLGVKMPPTHLHISCCIVDTQISISTGDRLFTAD